MFSDATLSDINVVLFYVLSQYRVNTFRNIKANDKVIEAKASKMMFFFISQLSVDSWKIYFEAKRTCLY